MSDDDGPLFAPRPGLFLGYPILDEKQWRRANKAKLRRCPTCGQDTVDRIKSLGPLQVRALAYLHALCRNEPTGWVHRTRVAERMPKGFEMGGELARLRYWGFTQQQPKTRGWWTTTDFALAFLTGNAEVPARIGLAEWRKAKKLLGFFGPMIDVGAAMKGANFDLQEVLDSARPSLDK